MIRFACPSCQAAYSVDDQKAGKKSKCPKCGQRIEVPTPQREVTSMGILLPDLEDFGNGPQVVEAPAPMGAPDHDMPTAIFLKDNGPDLPLLETPDDEWDTDHQTSRWGVEQLPLADRDAVQAPGNESFPKLPNLICAKCGRPLVKRFGKMSSSSFLRCSGFDEGACDYARPIGRDDLPTERMKANPLKPSLTQVHGIGGRKPQAVSLARESKSTSNASPQEGLPQDGSSVQWSPQQIVVLVAIGAIFTALMCWGVWPSNQSTRERVVTGQEAAGFRASLDSAPVRQLPPPPTRVFYDPPVPTAPLPPNGTTKRFQAGLAGAPLEIVTRDPERHFFVKVVQWDSDAQVVATMFVRAGQTAKTELPFGSYRIKYATGKVWYGEQHLFGKKTTGYHKAESRFDFRQQGTRAVGYTIELFLHTDGNLRTTELNPEDW